MPINIAWIFGFFLGDGSVYLRIWDGVTKLDFVPVFQIIQLNIAQNVQGILVFDIRKV